VPDDIESSLVAHFREFFEMASLPSGTMIGVLPVFTINGNNFEFAVSVESEASKIAAQEGLQVINREILDDVFRQEKWTAQMTLETDRAIEFGRHLGADAVLTGYILNLDSMLSLFVRIIDVEQAFVVASTQISLPNASPVP
jgi:TolB-like protein